MKTKFHILLELKDGEITPFRALQLLNTRPRVLKQLNTLWGPFLEGLVPLLDALQAQHNTKYEQTRIKRAIAKHIGITYRQVNRLLSDEKIDIPKPKSVEIRHEKKENAGMKREMHEKHALDVIAGLNRVDDAAEQAELSSRQMYRLVNRLTALVGVVYRDLRHTTHTVRKRVADQIEEILERV